jgi:hypothetical protein
MIAWLGTATKIETGLSRIWSSKWIGDKMSPGNTGDVDVSSDDIGERSPKSHTLSGVTGIRKSEFSDMLRFQIPQVKFQCQVSQVSGEWAEASG